MRKSGTNVGPEVILKKGINAASGINYATNLGNLTPNAAQTMLNMNKLPTYNYSIDVYKAMQGGATLSGPSWVSGPTKGLFGQFPTGAWEWAFTGAIPYDVIKWIK